MDAPLQDGIEGESLDFEGTRRDGARRIYFGQFGS
jgi:hypothetical protein